MTTKEYDQKIKKIHSELKQKWNATHHKISFCFEHKFDLQANVLQKENEARFDAIMMLEIEFDIR